MLLTALSSLGRHARLALPAGIVIALILPDIPLRWGYHPAAEHHLDICCLHDPARSKVGWPCRACPRRLLLSVSIAGFILCLVPMFYAGLGNMGGLTAQYFPSLIWFAVAPPIASTVWICTLLGFGLHWRWKLLS